MHLEEQPVLGIEIPEKAAEDLVHPLRCQGAFLPLEPIAGPALDRQFEVYVEAPGATDLERGLQRILGTYSRVPETPQRPLPSDSERFHRLLRNGVLAQHHLLHAIRIATLRRHLRDRDRAPLEQVHSLAYYQRTLQTLPLHALKPGYIA